jgi:hypothetical protein
MGSGIKDGRYVRERQVLATVYFLFYFSVFGAMIGQGRLLSQVQPVLWNFNRDLTEFAVIALGLPRWMIAHPGSFWVFDILLFALPLVWLATGLRRWLGLLFVSFLALYLLLADIFWQVHHEPFILYVILPLSMITRRPDRFDGILRGCRYYFLYIFISAAIWKIARGGVFNGEEMSRILLIHHSELLSGDCTGWLCRGYSWLIDHPLVAQLLYIGGVGLEAAFFLGLFTRRYDRLLLGFAVLFVIADLFVMRIPYWTVLLGCVTLGLDTRPRKRTMVVYETTHHENLPALLDLCESRFPRVIVFLKEVSYFNVIGSDQPESRWPKTQFIVQPEAGSNRRSIRRLFRLLREQRSSHLHLATLDNNLFLWAANLAMAPGVQVSITIHEVNAFFARPLGTVRDWTEAVAKPVLRRRVRHYHFFLPAMAKRFSERMPQAATVFIPSRFYGAAGPDLEKVPARAAATARPFAILIPGSVDGTRRDYESVVEVFRNWPAGLQPLRLVLLGDSGSEFGRSLVERLRSLGTLQVRDYKGYIPESIYEREIREADLLWSPLRINKTGSRHNPEVYGQTTASGLTADILLNNIPSMAPAELILPDPFTIALLPYRDAREAGELLRRLIPDEGWWIGRRQAIHEAFLYFSRENFAAAFDELTGLTGEESY